MLTKILILTIFPIVYVLVVHLAIEYFGKGSSDPYDYEDYVNLGKKDGK